MLDRVLIADDEFLVRQFLDECVRRQGIDTVAVGTAEAAAAALRRDEFQMVFVDLKLGQANGLDLIRTARERLPHALFVVITAYGSVETAVDAMRLGAFDFLLKPVSPDQIAVMLEKGRKWMQLQASQGYLTRVLHADGDGVEDRPIIGDSSCMREVMALVRRVAPTSATVLVTGESGTGKELIARELHRLADPARNRAFIRMNCAAVPETLLESELFGHEKGAFTGATERRVGRFELADGGTLLLDEIGEISPAMQAKMLRVIQESEFERVGGSRTIRVQVRLIATTNRDLKKAVATGSFREDLYYRLNVFPIRLPPLRERGEDVTRIAEELLRRQAQRGRPARRFAPDALAAIARYSWPGNVRELENVVQRAAILEDSDEIQLRSLPDDIRCEVAATRVVTVSGPPLGLNLAEVEMSTIQRALVHTDGNRSQAARLLGISVRTLRNKLSGTASLAA